ncbi:MAG: hypothetical protein HZA54_05910 [Planctomycetes bacterium]|nr:hypothetical protein [Planctomycetota bacterium]
MAIPDGDPCFSRSEHAILRAFGAEALPGGAPGAPGAHEIDLAPTYERLFRAADPLALWGMRAYLRTIEFLPVLLARERVPFSRLPARARRRFVAAWDDSPLMPVRLAFMVLKATVGMAYTSHPAYAAAIGYSSDCLHEERPLGPVPVR